MAEQVQLVIPDDLNAAIIGALERFNRRQPDVLYLAGSTAANGFELHGVFDSAAKAAAFCRTADDFVGPVILNQPMPSGPWPGLEYPARKMVA